MTTTDKKGTIVRGISWLPAVLAALDKKAAQTGRNRSQLVNYACAQLLGLAVDLSVEIEEDHNDE